MICSEFDNRELAILGASLYFEKPVEEIIPEEFYLYLYNSKEDKIEKVEVWEKEKATLDHRDYLWGSFVDELQDIKCVTERYLNKEGKRRDFFIAMIDRAIPFYEETNDLQELFSNNYKQNLFEVLSMDPDLSLTQIRLSAKMMYKI